MITPLQTWILIVAVLAAAIALRLTRYLLHRHHSSGHTPAMLSEREMLYMPGDPLKSNTEDYDDGED